MCGCSSDSTLDANELEGDDGVSSSSGCSCSDEMVASRPKCRSDESRSLKRETSSCEAADSCHER